MDSISSIGDVVGPGLGEDGALSEANGESRIAAVSIVAGQPLRIDTDGKWTACSVDTYENATAIAIASASGSAGSEVLGIYIGKLELSTSTFTSSQPLFLAADGSITDVATTIIGEYITRLGKGLYSGSIYVQCEEPVEVSS